MQAPEHSVGVALGQEVTHFPLEQRFPDTHWFLHEPQLFRFVLRSKHIPLQSDFPPKQRHFPDTQVLPPVHLAPQTPQLLLSVVVLTQPPEQIDGVDLGQLVLQRPPLHFLPSAHLIPQPPQFSPSVAKALQTPLQRDLPGGQRHLELEQVCPPLHCFPHFPQWFVSVLISTQPPEQTLGVALGQEVPQRAFPQRWPEGHWVPHFPQLLTSVLGFVHFLLELIVQNNSVASHLQRPLTQVCPPLHLSPHLPQLLMFDFKLTQAPLQFSGVDAGQDVVHFPFEQR